MQIKRKLLFAFLAFVMALQPVLSAGMSVYAQETEEEVVMDESTRMSWPFTDEFETDPDDYVSTLSDEGAISHDSPSGDTSFISGDPYGIAVNDSDDAAFYASQYLGDADFSLQELRTDEFNGLTIYSFQQAYGDTKLRDCYLKIVTDDSGQVLGITSSLVQDMDDAGWDYSEEEEGFDLPEKFSGFEPDTFESVIETEVFPEGIEVTVPLIIDPETGTRYLADIDRQLICIDLAKLEQVGDRQEIMPIDLDSELVDDSQLVTYYMVTQVYDYFAKYGWYGPNGKDQPSMLQFDTSGETNGNASYAHFQDGFHVFNFGINDAASQALQVIGHEFFHGVSDTNLIGPYTNETGALNEALSDMVGNAIETDIQQYSPEENKWLQTFLQLHTYQNPIYVWDEYYTPKSDYPDTYNDEGSVHHNSTIISILAWAMYEAGMTPQDVFTFWFTFDLLLTPNTDFAETAVRVPWIAEIAGYSDYAALLKRVIETLRMENNELPDELPEHQGLIRFDNPFSEPAVIATLHDPYTENEYQTWPISQTDTMAAVVADGYYVISVKPADEESELVYLWDGSAWMETDAESLDEIQKEDYNDYVIYIGNGEITELE